MAMPHHNSRVQSCGRRASRLQLYAQHRLSRGTAGWPGEPYTIPVNIEINTTAKAKRRTDVKTAARAMTFDSGITG